MLVWEQKPQNVNSTTDLLKYSFGGGRGEGSFAFTPAPSRRNKTKKSHSCNKHHIFSSGLWPLPPVVGLPCASRFLQAVRRKAAQIAQTVMAGEAFQGLSPSNASKSAAVPPGSPLEKRGVCECWPVPSHLGPPKPPVFKGLAQVLQAAGLGRLG